MDELANQFHLGAADADMVDFPQGDPTYTAARFGAALEDGDMKAARLVAGEKTFQGLMAHTSGGFRRELGQALEAGDVHKARGLFGTAARIGALEGNDGRRASIIDSIDRLRGDRDAESVGAGRGETLAGALPRPPSLEGATQRADQQPSRYRRSL